MSQIETFFLVPNEPGSHTIAAETKMLFDAVISRPVDSWTDHPEVGDRRTLISPIPHERFVAVTLERATNDVTPNGMINSIQIVSRARLNSRYLDAQDTIELNALELCFDLETVTGEDIANTLRAAFVIDHEDLDQHPELPSRIYDCSPHQRLSSAIVAAIQSASPEPITIKPNVSIDIWHSGIFEPWHITINEFLDASTIELPKEHDTVKAIPKIMAIKTISRNANDKIVVCPRYREQMTDHDPIQVMLWIRALAELKASRG